MEATVLSVGKSVLSGALSYAKSALAEEVALQLGVRRDQAFITDELEMMQGFLMSVHEEGRDGSSKVVKIWVKQVRDVAYDVEDCLLDFAVRLDHQQSWTWWRIPRRLLDRRHVAKEMKELRSKVEDISQRNVRYCLIKESCGQPSSATTTISSEVLLHVAEAKTRAALHMDEEKVDLAKLIMEDGDDLGSAIGVWGASSDVGVTSIIRAAYDNQQVKDKFQCRAWVRLMHPFNPNDLFASLVRQFYQDSCEESGKASTQGEGTTTGLTVLKKMAAQDHSLVNEFNRYVTEKRYLVVIADVSTIEEWDWIKTYFPSMTGGRIIVSTQQFEVARLCTEQPCTISEIEQKWSFDKDLYVFYHKVEATRIKGHDKAESSSNGEITRAEEAARDEQKHADKKPTGVSKMAATLEEDRLIDRKAAKAKVINFIDQDGEVISICGMGGLGKTTLVTSLYQQELSERFQRRAWLTVPHLNHQEFYNDLLRQLHVDYHGDKEKPVTEAQQSNNGNETQPKKEQKPVDILAEILLEKKCLIVFDDLSSTMEWELIRQLLPSSKDKTTNRIIVTTRELNVAMCCSEKESKIYNLEFLTEEEALYLFEKKVFKDIKERESYANISGLAEQANLILKKCDGLPLAISTIGSFLATRPKTAIEWRNLNKHISAELEMNQELGMIKTVLASSYDGLPYYLKACFLYLSIFPEDHRIRWSRLVRRWIAEGYSRRIRDKTAVETGNSYITELINRSMVRPLQGDGIASGGNGFLDVHDLIRDIAISKATEENLVFTLDEGCYLNTQGKIRHLAVSSRWKRDKDAFERALDLSHLRSLTVFGRLEAFLISDKMRLLRVLDLEDTKGLTDQHLHQIGKLVHLIYLFLRGCDGHLRLPDSLGNLRHLQTLDVRDVYIINLPETIVKLDKLLYLHVGVVPPDEDKRTGTWLVDLEREIKSISRRLYCADHEVSEYTRACCNACSVCPCCRPVVLVLHLLILFWYLLFLPGRFLRVLARDGCAGVPAYFMGVDPSGVKFPRGIGKLKSLHTVGVVNIDGENAILKDLQDLTELRKLRVTGLNKKNRKNFCSAIANLKSLESLFVRSEGKPGLSGCLDGLSEPPNNLQSLKLYGNLVKLPAWIQKLTNLVKMELRSSCIPAKEVGEVLGNLQHLAILRLLRGSLEGQELCFSFQEKAFPSLKVLALNLPESIQSVKFEGAATTNKLELLQVEFEYWSSDDKETELFSGLPSLPSLKEVVLSRATIKFMESLRAQFDGYPNQPTVKLQS